MMRKILRYFFLLVLIAQVANAALDGLLYDDTMLRLEGEIKKCVRKQVIYAHNIANAKVEGFKPIRFEEELTELRQRPGWTPQNDSVVVEEEMAKMTKNRFKHQTYLRLYNLKMQVLKNVVKQGKV